jgi:hypothetical protein
MSERVSSGPRDPSIEPFLKKQRTLSTFSTFKKGGAKSIATESVATESIATESVATGISNRYIAPFCSTFVKVDFAPLFSKVDFAPLFSKVDFKSGLRGLEDQIISPIFQPALGVAK